jgi:N-acetylglucosamine-6-phosphate deacetylase
MKAAGLNDGDYILGGQTVYVRDGKAQLANGAIAASTTNLFTEFKNLLSLGIPFKSALKACTINPATVIKRDNRIGSLKVGKIADIIAVDRVYNLKAVIVKGNLIRR